MGRSNKSVKITDKRQGRVSRPATQDGHLGLLAHLGQRQVQKAPTTTRAWPPTQKRSKHLPALRLPGQQHRCPTWLLAPLGRACSAPWPDRTRATRTAARLRVPADAAPWSSSRESALRARSAFRTTPGPGLQRLFVGAARGPSAWPLRLCSALSALHLGTRLSGESGYLPVVGLP